MAVVAVVGILLAVYNEDATPGSKRWRWITMEMLPMAAAATLTSYHHHHHSPTPSSTPTTASLQTKHNKKLTSLISSSTMESLENISPTVNKQTTTRSYNNNNNTTFTLSTTTTTDITKDAGAAVSDNITVESDYHHQQQLAFNKGCDLVPSTSSRLLLANNTATTTPANITTTTAEPTTTTATTRRNKNNNIITPDGTSPTTTHSNNNNSTVKSNTVIVTGPSSTATTSSISPATTVCAKTTNGGCVSQCCWPECCTSSPCVHHHHQLSYYRSDTSVFCRVRRCWTQLVATARQFDSYTAMVRAGACSGIRSVRTVYRKVHLFASVVILKYVVSESKRQFFYMMEKKLLKLPIDWEESEISSYLHVKRHLKSKDMWPFMWTVSNINSEDNKITVNGHRSYVMSSYSYLDFIRHKAVQENAINVARQWATGSHGPRMLGGNSLILRQLEKSVARFFGRDDAMVLSGGFLACMSAICAVCKSGDLIVGDNRLHASLRAGLKLCGARVMYFKHNDSVHLSKLLVKHRKKYRACWLAIESVYSMDGDTADLRACVNLSNKHDCKIILDEAHGLGVVGSTGRGLEELYGLHGVCTLIVGTFSKSIATVGGYITGSQDLIDFMDFHAPGNVFSAPLAAYCAGAALRSFELIDEESWRVTKAQNNSKFLREALTTGLGHWPDNYPHTHKYSVEGDPSTTVIPIVFKDDIDRVMRIASNMLRRGWMIAAVAFPACPLRSPRFRITATCAYTDDIMREFVEALVAVCCEEQPAPMGEDFVI
eukprot:GHVS01010340.1.p1 GENE.GHVS01010340.1~~GHVS01010340.1.p1  ORF type:complete len:868 (+),score=146.73 GHVS01010340.1:287-2605(+)